MKTKEEILKAKTAHEVLEWMKATLPPHDPDVVKLWNRLIAKEFEEMIGSDYDPEMHYDFLTRKKNDVQNS